METFPLLYNIQLYSINNSKKKIDKRHVFSTAIITFNYRNRKEDKKCNVIFPFDPFNLKIEVMEYKEEDMKETNEDEATFVSKITSLTTSFPR